MTTRFVENLVADFNTITLLDGQNFLAPAGYQVTSINAAAVYATGADHRMSVGASLSGGFAAILVEDGSNTRVTVTGTGLLMGGEVGIGLLDPSSRVINYGTITSLLGSAIELDIPAPAELFAAAVVSDPVDPKFVIRNFGTINGATGITTGAGRATIVNEGLIVATETFAIVTGALADTVTNLARIRGDIDLGAGADSLTNEASIRGDVDLGADNDTLVNSATIRGTVLGGEGNDVIEHEAGVITAIDLGNGSNTLTNVAQVTGKVTGGTGSDNVQNAGGRIGSIDLGGGSNTIVNAGGRIGSIVLGDGGNTINNRGQIDTTVLAGAGADIFDNSAATGTNALTISMGGGADFFTPGAVLEAAVGGDGEDTLNFSNTTGITVALDGSRANTGVAANDSYSGFERILGSLTGANTLIGNAFDNTFTGGAANDVLQGKEGSDDLRGNAGDDNLDGGNGDDFIDGAAGNDRLVGGTNRDIIRGGDGADTIRGDSEDDTLSGGNGDDDIVGGSNNDRLNGDDGNDRLIGGQGVDTINGGNGNDFIKGETENDIVSGGAGNDDIGGDDGNDTLNGDAGDDVLRGNNGDDTINGGDGLDNLAGGEGNDTLNGGGGNDALRLDGGDDTVTGGSGADLFDFSGLAGFKDTITDFTRSQGDKIALSAIDAKSGVAGDQAFTFIGTQAFHNIAGELRFSTVNGTTAVSGDVNGDGQADFTFSLTNGATLAASDFVL